MFQRPGPYELRAGRCSRQIREIHARHSSSSPGPPKTSLALELAEHLPIEVISADSRQVYRGLDVGQPNPRSPKESAYHITLLT